MEQNLQPLINQVQAWWTDEHSGCQPEIPQARLGLEGAGLEYLFNYDAVSESLDIPSFQMCCFGCGWRNGRSRDQLVQSLRPRLKASAVMASRILQQPDVQVTQQVASALVPQPVGTELALVTDLIQAAGAQTVQGRNRALVGAGVSASALFFLFLLGRK